jgi:Fic family protein
MALDYVEIPNTPYSISAKLEGDIEALASRVSKLRNAGQLDSSALREIAQFFKIRNIYESNAIEGNELDYGETKLVVEQGITLAGKSLKDQAEAKNLSAALDFLNELAADNTRPIGESDVRQIHNFVLSSINDEYAGRYRDRPVTIGGSKFSTPSPNDIPPQMAAFGAWLQQASIPHADYATITGLTNAVVAHTWFVTIHPFIDGNGRVARMLMNLILTRYGFPIAIISKDDRLRYYDSLEASQVSDLSSVIQLVMECVEESLEEYERIAQSQRERLRFARSIADQLTEPQRLQFSTEYEIWKSAMDLFKGFFRQSAVQISQQSQNYAHVYCDDFGSLDLEKYTTLRAGSSAKRTWFFRIGIVAGERSARYLFFFGYPSIVMQKSCQVTAFIAKEQLKYDYQRTEFLPSNESPEVVEIGYQIESEAFVARKRGGQVVVGRAEEIGIDFIREAVEIFLAT